MKLQQFRLPGILILLAVFLLPGYTAGFGKVHKGITVTTGGTGIGAVRPAGIPLETPVTTVIGPEGGKLISKDGKMEVLVPAGAVQHPTSFGVAAISSTSDAAVGNSYRITPHYIFSKAVTISISYNEDSVSSPCLLSAGYRDEKGQWKMLTRRVLDEKKKRVQVSTRHFSDWVMLTPLRLTPSYSLIHPKEEVVLVVAAYVSITPGTITSPGNACNVFANGKAEEVVVEEKYILPDSQIDKWISTAGESEGAGRLVRTEKGAIYTASGHASPVINPVKVLCFLKSRQFPMKAIIRIKPVEIGVYIEAGNLTRFYKKCRGTVEGSSMSIEWESESGAGNTIFHGNIMVSGTLAGGRPWSDRVQFSWEPENTSPPLLYTSYWDDGLKISAGRVDFTKVGKVGELMEGVFELSNAGEYLSATDSEDVKYTGVKSVRGYFTVIRTY